MSSCSTPLQVGTHERGAEERTAAYTDGKSPSGTINVITEVTMYSYLVCYIVHKEGVNICSDIEISTEFPLNNFKIIKQLRRSIASTNSVEMQNIIFTNIIRLDSL